MLNIINLLAPAFVVGALISLVHVPLGQEVLRRNIIFLDLAVAQFAALGMIVFQVFALVDDHSIWAAYGRLSAGLLSAILCALAFHILEKRSGAYQEALIGCAFVLAASLGLILLSNSPHGADEIKNILEGQILWTSWDNIFFIAPIFITVFFVWLIFKNKRSSLFYPLFAIIIPFSVSTLGIYLVFASLIFPALAVAKMQNNQWFYGVFISAGSYLIGLAASYLFDWPAGPAIIVAFCFICMLFYTGRAYKKCSGQ